MTIHPEDSTTFLYFSLNVSTNKPTINMFYRALNVYHHQQEAQRLRDQRRRVTHKAFKMILECILYIEENLFEKWSPEQIPGWLLAANKGYALSHATVSHVQYKLCLN